jgi:hypothetical protein
MHRLPALLGLVSILTGCAASTPSANRPRLDPLDGRLVEPCARPANLPAGALTDRDVERFWSADRAALGACGDRHKALAEAVTRRDRAIAGAAGGAAQKVETGLQ